MFMYFFQAKQEELVRAETLDTGKPIWEARFDIQGCADSVEYYGGLASTISGKFSGKCVVMLFILMVVLNNVMTCEGHLANS